jgi:hypothetical protein
MIIRINATCSTCQRQGKENYCVPCQKRIGHRLYQAIPEVEVEEHKQIRYGRHDKVMFDTVLIIKKAAI